MAEENVIFSPSSLVTMKDIEKLDFDHSKDILGVAMAQWKEEVSEDDWEDVGTSTMVIHYKDFKRKNYFLGVYCYKKRKIIREIAITADTQYIYKDDYFFALYNPDNYSKVGLLFKEEEEANFLGKMLKARIGKRKKLESNKGQKSKRSLSLGSQGGTRKKSKSKDKGKVSVSRTQSEKSIKPLDKKKQGSEEIRKPQNNLNCNGNNLAIIEEKYNKKEMENVYQSESDDNNEPPEQVIDDPPPRPPKPSPNSLLMSSFRKKTNPPQRQPSVKGSIKPLPPPRPLCNGSLTSYKEKGNPRSKGFHTSEPPASPPRAELYANSSIIQGVAPPSPPTPPLSQQTSSRGPSKSPILDRHSQPRENESDLALPSRASLLSDIQSGVGRFKLRSVVNSVRVPVKEPENHMRSLIEKVINIGIVTLASDTEADSGSESDWE